MSERAVILLAEDRDDDVLLVRRALGQAYIDNPLQVVRDGEEAIHYLSGQGRYFDREVYPLPVLLLLDLKMPRMDGFEVLKWIRHHPELAGMRVVVLTGAENIQDAKEAYSLGANSFMVKPLDFGDVMQLGKYLANNWLPPTPIEPLVEKMPDGPGREKSGGAGTGAAN